MGAPASAIPVEVRVGHLPHAIAHDARLEGLAMADRILRTGLFDSEAWLGLKDNTDRVCWIHLFGSADTFGNQPGGPLRLLHLWRPYGVDTVEKVAKILSELQDADLARPYQVDGKPYIHIPRYRQSHRYLGKCWPLSEWATNEDKQRLMKKSPADHSDSPEASCDSPVVVVVEVVKDEVRKIGPVDNSPPVDNSKAMRSWAEHWKAKGKALGMNPHPGESEGAYCRRVQDHAKTTT